MKTIFTILSFFVPLSLFGNETDLRLLIQGPLPNELINVVENTNSRSNSIKLEIQMDKNISERLILKISNTSVLKVTKSQLIDELRMLLGSSVQVNEVGINELTIGSQDDMM